MHTEKIAVIILATVFVAMFISSCASLYTESTTSFDRTKITADIKTNGIVVTISTKREIGNVEAWIGDDNWLYITIPDTSIDLDEVNRLEDGPVFSRVLCFRHQDSVQLTFRMKEKVDHLDVVRYPDSKDIYIALYKFKI